MKWKIGLIASLGLSLVSISEANASLTPSYQFNGMGNWAIDGTGGTNAVTRNLEVSIPEGSIVEKAFLYSSMWSDSGPPVMPTVVLDGITYSTEFTNLGAFQPLPTTVPNFYLGAWRTDVTPQVATKVGGGSASPFSFSVDSENPDGNIDGEVLAVVYSNPLEQERTIAILDGFSETTGDSATVNFAEPIDPTVAGFEALLSLGIGFGFQPGGQVSLVDINGQRLTSSAGGQDDGIPLGTGNGGLITVGGTGDSPNLPDPFAPATSIRTDDEYYDLALGSFLSIGDTALLVETLNPSNDDNIFFLGLNITAEADVCVGPECEKVPEPSSILGLITLGILGAGVKLKKK